MSLTKEEKDAVIQQAEANKKQQEMFKKKQEAFEKEYKELCEKYGVVPVIHNDELRQALDLLPKIVESQKIMFVFKG